MSVNAAWRKSLLLVLSHHYRVAYEMTSLEFAGTVVLFFFFFLLPYMSF